MMHKKNPFKVSNDSCCCVGPQNNEPRCPCLMKNIIVRDGRYIEPEKDLGPVEQISKIKRPGHWIK